MTPADAGHCDATPDFGEKTMSDNIPLGQAVSIRDAGFDEFWLQDQICESPACLGLGDLEVLAKERVQASGGRLDILLKDPEDDTMYELEVMLGETDESHIIRTIEYWLNERRRWPQRQHYAVLVAESITRRFFNVIQLLSESVPIIAVQASVVESPHGRALFLTRVLDTYEEPEDGTTVSNEIHDEQFWQAKAPWTLEAAKALLDAVSDEFDDPRLNYVKGYVAIRAHNRNYFWLHKRSAKKSLLGFRISNGLLDEAKAILDQNNVPYVHKRKLLLLTVDRPLVEERREMFVALAKLVKSARER